MSLPQRYVVVDLETTGVHPVRDRITEIAVLRVENGVETGRWQSLVCPGVSIPPMIQRLIGITDAMVANAPTFESLSDTLAGWLEGSVFVAHNARFDYGFIQQAFKRMGRRFEMPVLCTVKLSRSLYPHYPRHGLDALIERFGLTCTARHRAMGDVDVLGRFLELVRARFSDDALASAVGKAMSGPEPPGLPAGVLDALPDAPGVYLFYSQSEPRPGDRPLYLAHCASLRGRVRPWFSNIQGHGKEAELARKVRYIDWMETAGKFGARLLEAQLQRTLRPTQNRLPPNSPHVAIRLLKNRRRPPVVDYVDIEGSDPCTWEKDLSGAFHGRVEAENRLANLAAAYRLCPQRLGLEPGRQACSAMQSGRCAGVCGGAETSHEHDERLAAALQTLRLKPWAWLGKVYLHEISEDNTRQQFYLFDQWCCLGQTDNLAQLNDLAAGSKRIFDLEIYRLLLRWTASPAHMQQFSAWPPQDRPLL